MERLDSYAAIENKIRLGEVMLSEVERLLDTLHRQKLITPSELETLLELAWSKTIDHQM
jgi:hypothetical protein